MNDEVLKLLPVEKKQIKNFDTCLLTHFENLKCIYVSNAQELKEIETNIKNIAGWLIIGIPIIIHYNFIVYNFIDFFFIIQYC